MVASSAICDLLYQLGISANYKGFLHTAYAVSLCVEQQDRLLLVTKWLYPDVARILCLLSFFASGSNKNFETTI